MSTREGGARLGDYELIAELGRGGMGIVHLALAHGAFAVTRPVAVKVLKSELAEDPEFVQMLVTEARLAARIAHPNVAQTLSAGIAEGKPFIVMELLEGQSLARLLLRFRDHEKFSLPQRLLVLRDILAGLEGCYDALGSDGNPVFLAHRDVSPENVFVTYDGFAKVLDFGVAKSRLAGRETDAGIVKGRLAFMAPEQARGEWTDGRADVFAVGLMLWEAITLQSPWNGRGVAAAVRSLCAGEVPAAERYAPVPAGLLDVLNEALAPEARDRFPSARAFRLALEALPEMQPARRNEFADLLQREFAEERRAFRRRVSDALGAASSRTHSLRAPDEGGDSISSLHVDGSTRRQAEPRKLGLGALWFGVAALFAGALILRARPGPTAFAPEEDAPSSHGILPTADGAAEDPTFPSSLVTAPVASVLAMASSPPRPKKEPGGARPKGPSPRAESPSSPLPSSFSFRSSAPPDLSATPDTGERPPLVLESPYAH